MAPLINFTEPVTVLVALVLFLLVLFLGRETKKGIIPAIMLGIFVIVVVVHSVEFSTAKTLELQTMLAKCMAVDFVFILLSFFSYLWVDEIETKSSKKKSIDNSLKWFWSKV